MVELFPGALAPDFQLSDANGASVTLKDFSGSKVILYFYPAALTPGCTVEAIDFSAAKDAFQAAGYAIVGVSPDDPDQLRKFVTHNDLSITLLGDPDLEVIKAYGAWGDRTLWGKVFTGVIRSTFVIDVDSSGEGRILVAQYGVRATGHVKRLRTELGV